MGEEAVSSTLLVDLLLGLKLKMMPIVEMGIQGKQKPVEIVDNLLNMLQDEMDVVVQAAVAGEMDEFQRLGEEVVQMREELEKKAAQLEEEITAGIMAEHQVHIDVGWAWVTLQQQKARVQAEQAYAVATSQPDDDKYIEWDHEALKEAGQ